MPTECSAEQAHWPLPRPHQGGAAALGGAFFGILASDRQPQAKAARQHRVAALNLVAMVDAAEAR